MKLVLAIVWSHGFSQHGRVYYIFVFDVTVYNLHLQPGYHLPDSSIFGVDHQPKQRRSYLHRLGRS